MQSSRSLNRFDSYLILALLIITALYSIRSLAFTVHPKEDAAILMRYSNHLAQGHGIVWNVGEDPVDGATDFLYMVVLAGLVKMGTSVETAARGLGFLAHLLTVLLVYFAVRTLHRANRWLALAAGLYLALGPGSAYTAAYFGTPFFALFLALTWWLANRIVQLGDSLRRSLLFSLSALVMGLIRPEGVLVAVFFLAAILWMRGWKESRRVVTSFVLIFAILGGAYFLWRWDYFGYPLPNPFYKKGGGHLYIYSLRVAIRNTIVLAGPFLIPFVLGFRSREKAKQAVFALIPTVCFVGMWILLSNEMNILMRFQYPIVPVVLISTPGLLVGIADDWHLPKLGEMRRGHRIVLLLLVALVFLGTLHYPYRKYFHRVQHRDGRYDVAVMLKGYAGRGYTLASTEAGLLPLYSEWRTIDTWGLNDSWIAHHGGITEAYLEENDPEIIVFHGYFSPIAPAHRNRWNNPWHLMVKMLNAYSEARGYILAASYGDDPHDTHYYYVRPDFPASTEIISRIRRIDYRWHASGKTCANYAVMSPEP